eukprot:CAMPEP_0118687610 /NCGR_PEP_ID=MMETSP0800-20121206/8479_1 /TAXON_ID=210618 ORGANISM="Striatella unipunctata, Strain CCMP2910" /NCGR_SAMPLE_ID=MMETSP0800 /ASSEMBLY_ACC=CAM_ASM_000638 /LENGTH=291 /DNA_ID=CAMNT_0006584815 /DNA_START=258 /DNA_END=1133 /DNA_ORIENTATION=-
MAFAPKYFGFFAYFGALTAIQEELDGILFHGTGNHVNKQKKVVSVVGSSAGAMAAVLLSSGVEPRKAAEFACSLGLTSFADPPGVGGILRGLLFERLMDEFMQGESHTDDESSRNGPFLFEEGVVPAAVCGFDLLTRKTVFMTEGSMAKAARASACFPVLFQPVPWKDANNGKRSLLIDGGIHDHYGVLGLSAIQGEKKDIRVINICMDANMSNIPSPSKMPDGIKVKEMVSINLRNSPSCGALSLEQGPQAVEAARKAFTEILDAPMPKGKEEGHYIIDFDASTVCDIDC